MSNFYDQLCDSFIRPSRQIYNAFDLGQPVAQHWKRFDFTVSNSRQNKIMGSYFNNNRHAFAPCIVYLHSLNGSRLQSISYADQIIAKGFNFCSFDFSGTGLSQGKYVSLGFFEKLDIFAVLQYVSNKFGIKKFVLWGRSMGAAAGIKYMSMISASNKNNKDIQYEIEALILDSPFHSLSQITVQLAKQKISMPEIFIKAVIMMVESNIEKKAGFRISEMQLLEDIKLIKCPVLLLTSKEDKLVNSNQSQKIYEAISHRDRQIMFIKGEHNSSRDAQTIQYILNFAHQSTNKKRVSKQNLVKSSKLLNYRVKNNLVVSSAIASKSSKKLQNNSLEVRYQTCEDDEIISTRWDQQFQEKIHAHNNKKASKISLQLYSPKINYQEEVREHERTNGQSILLIKVKGSDCHERVSNYMDMKNSTNEKNRKYEQNLQYQSQKKPAFSIPNSHKNCFEINKSPIKQPPRITAFNHKQEKKINWHPVPKTPQNKPSIGQNQSNMMQKIYLSQKKQDRVHRLEYHHRAAINESNSTSSYVPSIQVNHLNVITNKLKKKKKQDRNESPCIQYNNKSEVRNISVSIERKSQLCIKSPPELLNKKLINKI